MNNLNFLYTYGKQYGVQKMMTKKEIEESLKKLNDALRYPDELNRGSYKPRKIKLSFIYEIYNETCNYFHPYEYCYTVEINYDLYMDYLKEKSCKSRNTYN